MALKKRLYQVNKIKTKITILDVEREDRFGPLFLRLFFAILHFSRSVGRAGARGFLFFLKFCVCGKSYLILSCGKSSRPVQSPGESQDIISGDVIVKAEGL